MFSNLKEINSNEIKCVGGGCQCVCNRKPDDISTDNLYSIGEAKSLKECSEVCLENEWVIARCDIPSKKEDKD
jgi:hypothetical protein